MVGEGSIHSTMHSAYSLNISGQEWVEAMRKLARQFAPTTRIHLHFFEHNAAADVDGLMDRITDDVVSRLAGADAINRLREPEAWTTTEALDRGMVAIDIGFEGSRAVALVEDAGQVTDSELASTELLLHHWEASFLLRQLLTRMPDVEVPRDGLRILMRYLRQEAEYVRLSEDFSLVWRGLLDGTWTLVELNRNQSRWQFVVKENPEGYEDPRALSRRESQVLERAANGESNKVIAHGLGLEESTIGSYLQRALGKLQLANRVELVSLRTAIVAYEETKYLRDPDLRESSVTVLDALDRLDRPDTKTIVANLRALVTRLE